MKMMFILCRTILWRSLRWRLGFMPELSNVGASIWKGP